MPLSHYPSNAIYIRVPANCGYSNEHQPVQITENSPGPYSQMNSGTLVLNPSARDASAIKKFLAESPLVPTFRFPDQDALSEIYKGKWKLLPWNYNALKTLRDIHPNLWKDEEVRCLHYILAGKPWSMRPGEGGDYDVVNRWWWEAFEGLGAEMNAEDAPAAVRADWKLLEANVAPPTKTGEPRQVKREEGWVESRNP